MAATDDFAARQARFGRGEEESPLAGALESWSEWHQRNPWLSMGAALGAGLVAGSLLSRLASGPEATMTIGRRLAGTAAAVGESLRERAGEAVEASSELLGKARDQAGRAAEAVAEKSSAAWTEVLSGLGSLAMALGADRWFRK